MIFDIFNIILDIKFLYEVDPRTLSSGKLWKTGHTSNEPMYDNFSIQKKKKKI